MTTEIILAGFGGQGILFAGKVLAYCALIDGKEDLVAAVLRSRNARRYGELLRVHFR